MEHTTDFSWLAYTQLLDSALPIGGFSHSFGLETLVQDGRIERPDQLKDYMEAMLFHSWAPVDALAVKAVYGYAPGERWEELWLVDRTQHVQRASAETREGVAKMGRRLLQLARAIYPQLEWEPLAGAMRDGRCIGTHPLVHGWISLQLGVPLPAAAEGYLYTCVTTGINSGLRLMSLGQTDGQRLLAALLPSIREAWLHFAPLDPLEDGFSSTPQAEIAMMRHEGLYSRLFMS
ncbi:urease accessory protein UreF [Paenibacillus sp. MZ04-78.2]|uniref:urease accessory protein UreF n=1 Tax=Paenibacillus sp. MZ04-78.2 TaxID=2962034 RepID=UPI0020B63F7B|nr:urease accessory UreF family protein [Paenibacillus sp. MZ04-78.2]MCP3774688.1 urease accessory protein UreF [Paenibacillus sp. MZ04-78.2]